MNDVISLTPDEIRHPFDRPRDEPAEIHDKPWYKETPCWSHGQIERSPDDPCGMGEYLLARNEVLT